MEFRSVALIALWTLIGGPILGTPTGPASGNRPAVVKPTPAKAKQLVPHSSKPAR